MEPQQTMDAKTIWSKNRPRTVFLARHGQSESNLEERISGQTDPSLTEKGQRQAERLAAVLRDIPLTKILTSSLRRSIETARPMAESQGITVCPQDALKEMSFGVVEGRMRSQLDQESQHLLDQWTQDKLHFRIPGGENLFDVQRRVLPLLGQVLANNPDGILLIVGHRYTNLVLLSALMGWNLKSIAACSIQSKYVYEMHCCSTPIIHTIRLTGEGRGSRVEGFLNEDGHMCSLHDRSVFSEKPEHKDALPARQSVVKEESCKT
jgi:broad specificity phosphatase PhoE